MRYDDVYAAGVGSFVPPSVPVSEAVGAGMCPAELAAESGIEAVAISAEMAPPEMAAIAVRAAVDRAGLATERIGLIAYADSHYSGHDSWIAAAYVQRVAIGVHNPLLCLDVRQLSNGGMAALELSAAFLHGAGGRAAVIAAADRFAPPGYDRWRSEPGICLGDGAAALLLSRDGGFARLRSVVSWTDPEMEGARRGDDQFGAAPGSLRPTVDACARREEFIARLGADNYGRLAMRHRRSAIELALSEAGRRIDEIDWFVLPSLGRARLVAEYLDPFGIGWSRTAWPFWARHVGHLGAADQFAGLEFLMRSGRLGAGQTCMLVGAGGDVISSCAILEVTDTPDWAVLQLADKPGLACSD